MLYMLFAKIWVDREGVGGCSQVNTFEQVQVWSDGTTPPHCGQNDRQTRLTKLPFHTPLRAVTIKAKKVSEKVKCLVCLKL